MKKIDNFTSSLNLLANADYSRANDDEIYRSGIAHQYSLTFELAWKALKQFMQDRGIEAAVTGSTIDIIRLAFQAELIDDFSIWRQMSRDRNITNHVYNADEVDQLIHNIQTQYLNELKKLQRTLTQKITEPEPPLSRL